MNEQTAKTPEFKVALQEPKEAGGSFIFTVETKKRHGGNETMSMRLPHYAVAVRQDSTGLNFDWSPSPDEPPAARADIEADIRG